MFLCPVQLTTWHALPLLPTIGSPFYVQSMARVHAILASLVQRQSHWRVNVEVEQFLDVEEIVDNNCNLQELGHHFLNYASILDIVIHWDSSVYTSLLGTMTWRMYIVFDMDTLNLTLAISHVCHVFIGSLKSLVFVFAFCLAYHSNVSTSAHLCQTMHVSNTMILWLTIVTFIASIVACSLLLNCIP